MADIEKVKKGLECCSKGLGYCQECPYVDESCSNLELDALELLKEQQPKLLTLIETINAKYPMDVFCEIKREERVFAVTAPVPAQWIGKPDIRYWTARPTEEQRKAEPWRDGEQE